MDVGTALREARQRAGLSREQISQSTKIQLAKIEALEANAFERLPEGIYLDGLIRAYAREVGLDGDALVAAVPPIERAVIPPPETSPYADPALAPPQSDPDLFIVAPAAEDGESGRFRDVPVHAFSGPTFASPTRSRGAGRFVLPLLALIAAVGLGAYIYATNRPFAMPGEIGVPPLAESHVPEDAAPVDAPVSNADHHQDTATPEPEHAINATDAAGRRDTVTADTPAPERRAPETAKAPEALEASGTPGASAAPAAPAARSTRHAAGDAPGKAAGDVRDLAGEWALDTRVETSSYTSYEGLELGYRLRLRQDGNRLAGEGVKLIENGRSLGGRAQTEIAVEGSIQGDRITLTFSERGTRRETGGKMILDVTEEGVLRGRFSSSAARSTGTVEARRVSGDAPAR